LFEELLLVKKSNRATACNISRMTAAPEHISQRQLRNDSAAVL
jgi:hypothetical protein